MQHTLVASSQLPGKSTLWSYTLDAALKGGLSCSILQMAENPDMIRWLPEARLNIAEAALCTRSQRATAIVWADEAAPDKLARVTLGELRGQCQQVAAALAAAGYAAGCHFCLMLLFMQACVM